MLKAFDLAVQKQKLTTLEHEMLNTKPGKESKIDVSPLMFDQVKSELLEFMFHCAETETPDVLETDEPFAANSARKLIEKFDLKEV